MSSVSLFEKNFMNINKNFCNFSTNYGNESLGMDVKCEESSGQNGIDKSHDEPFTMLRFLNLNGTLLSTWDDVESLATFPALKSLRMQGCPLFEVKITRILHLQTPFKCKCLQIDNRTLLVLLPANGNEYSVFSFPPITLLLFSPYYP